MSYALAILLRWNARKTVERIGKTDQARAVLDDMLATSKHAPKEDNPHVREGWLIRLFL